MARQLPKDTEWLRRSFMVPIRAATHQYELREVLNGAAFKFTDTTPGGSFAINPPPQFTLLADRPVKGLMMPKGRYGGEMGRYYSEALDDNGTLVHMRFGVPQFNSLTNFFINAYNHKTSIMVRTGRSSASFYQLGRIFGFVVTLPFQPILWVGRALNFFSGKQASRYYYSKPAMPMYWSAVATMVNAIGVNMGQIGRAMSKEERDQLDDGDPVDGDTFGRYGEILPEIYRDDGGIDVYAMSTRAQRMAHRRRLKLQGLLRKHGSEEELGRALADYRREMDQEPTGRTLEEAIESYHGAEVNSFNAIVDDKAKEEDPTGRSANERNSTGDEFDELTKTDFVDHLTAELQDGASWITLRVDDPGPVSESFSNTVEESEIASKINSMSASARSTRFSFAEGNIADNLLINTIGDAVKAVRDVVQGGLSSVGLDGLNVLAGSAYIDIPKMWSDSTANLPTASYTMELRSPYGNRLSRLQNLYIPLAMILAAALPLSTGKQSYTSPFLVELYCKGRNQTRLGMIDSLSITRGTGNLGFNQQKEPLAIDVSFSVIDLSTIMHMPVSPHLSLGNIAKDLVGNFDDDNLYTDYLAVLGSMSLADQVYGMNRQRNRRMRGMANWEQWKSSAHHANWLLGGTTGRVLSMLTHITDRSG